MYKVTLYWGVGNYFSRKIRENLALHTKAIDFDNIQNFDYNDGINSQLTINFAPGTVESSSQMTDFPTYLVALDENHNMTDWFITNAVVTRNLQLVLSLKRDLLSEKWETISDSQFLCERASTLPNSVSQAKYNKSTSLSQIKRREYVLSDREDGEGWLIGYVDRNFMDKLADDSGNVGVSELTVSLPTHRAQFDFYTSDSMENFLQEHYVSNVHAQYNWYAWGNYTLSAGIAQVQQRTTYGNTIPDEGLSISDDDLYSAANKSWSYVGDETSKNGFDSYPYDAAYNMHSYEFWSTKKIPWSTLDEEVWTAENAAFKNMMTTLLNEHKIYGITDYYFRSNPKDILQYDNKIVYSDRDGEFYRVTVKKRIGAYLFIPETQDDGTKDYTYGTRLTDEDALAMYQALAGKEYFGSGWTQQEAKNTTSFTAYGDVYDVTYEKLAMATSTQANITLKASRVHSSDTFYDIFAIPLGGMFKRTFADPNDSSKSITRTTRNQIRRTDLLYLMNSLYNRLGQYLYDLQLLPYGPIADETIYSGMTEAHGVLRRDDAGYSYSLIAKGPETATQNDPYGILLWLNSSQASRFIPFSDFKMPKSNIETRYKNEEEYYQLVAPNYASQYEFSPYRNEGLDGFNVSIAFKVYSPYVKIAPRFNDNGLYGGNYNDARGLVLAGDYSVSRVTDSWTNFKLQNKNYELIFNRQIQSMDLDAGISTALEYEQLKQTKLAAVSGTFQGAASGATRGAITGSAAGPWGAVIGAAVGGVAGGVTSGIGAVKDVQATEQEIGFNQLKRAREKNLALIGHQENISAIKAQPTTITNIDTFNPNYRDYPVLEVYTCSESEAANLTKSVTYSGWDVNMLCALGDFQYGYIQGHIVEPVAGISSPELMAINDELNAGIYLTSEKPLTWFKEATIIEKGGSTT